jgi:ATP-dependent DNA helicase DinG
LDPTQSVIDFFSDQGPLAQHFQGYQGRKGQIDMARHIALGIQRHEHLVIEAGTGVGKSFAYLAPMLLQKKRKQPIVVSTGTIALQEQLVQKDCPFLARCLGQPLKVVLAKGRQHYLCENRFRRQLEHLENIASDDRDLETLQKLKALIGRSIISKTNIPGYLSDEAWSHIRSETGLCGHSLCKDKPCSFTLARRELNEADIIVVNHSLLFVHLQLARLGASLIPPFSQLILDEAHHCPDTATEQFGLHVSNHQVKYFLDQLYAEKKQRGFLTRLRPAPTLIQKKVVELRGTSDAFFSALRFWLENEGPENGRVKTPQPFENPLTPALKDLENLLNNWAGSAENSDEEREFRYYANRARSLAEEVDSFVKQSLKDAAYWIESKFSSHRGFHIEGRAAPLDVSAALKELLFKHIDCVVMTSATLCAGHLNSFEFFRKRMGMDKGNEAKVESPFDYKDNVMLWGTRRMASPQEPIWLQQLTGVLLERIQLTAGGVFILTTSHQLLRFLHSELELWTHQNGYLLLAQGLSGQRQQLLDKFRAHPKAILIGSSTFWEGIDVPGPSLRHVIIPRLPFEVPNHPLLESRYELVEKQGGQPFRELALPHALIRFKQGFGRLIRQAEDLGIVSVLDSRLLTKTYGRDFIQTLPPCELLVDEPPSDGFMNRMRRSWSQWSKSLPAHPLPPKD